MTSSWNSGPSRIMIMHYWYNNPQTTSPNRPWKLSGNEKAIEVNPLTAICNQGKISPYNYQYNIKQNKESHLITTYVLYKKVKMLQAVFEKYNKQMKYLFNVFHIFIHLWLSDVGRASLKSPWTVTKFWKRIGKTPPLCKETTASGLLSEAFGTLIFNGEFWMLTV